MAIVHRDEFHDLKKGCAVRVKGEPGRFTFVAWCANTDTAAEWIDVFGGPSGYETMRAFKPDRVTRR
jgi:hypothetical protein